MRLEVRKYLYDVQQAADLVTTFTTGRSFDEYTNDPMPRSAVERQFEIIGEALTQLRRQDNTVALAVSDHQRIIAFRNIRIHGYADIDNRLVWDIVVSKLPILRKEVQAMLGG